MAMVVILEIFEHCLMNERLRLTLFVKDKSKSGGGGGGGVGQGRGFKQATN